MSKSATPIQKVDNDTLKRNIRALLKQRSMSQTDLANEIGMSQPNMNKRLSLKTDTHRFTLDQLWAIADYFEVSIDDLLGRKAKPKTSSLQEVCRFIIDLIETHQVHYTKIERDETEEQIFDLGEDYPRHHNVPDHVTYYAIYFHNYFYRDDARNDIDYMNICDVIDDEGNTMQSNIRINDFLNHFIDAFEKYESQEYTDEVYQILVKTYLENLV